MSHILDALQKVQDEKAAKLKQSTMTAGILLETPVRRQNEKRLYLFGSAAVIVVLCAAALVIWSSLTSSKPGSKEALRTVAPQQPPIATMPTAPPLPPVAQPPAQAVSPVPVPMPAAPPPPRSAEKTGAEPATNRSKMQQPQNNSAAAAIKPVETVLSSAPEGVKLTGIAWQENHKTRRAVINDTLVGEGAVIAGAKVIEIRPDMVRFEKNGAVFEVTLLR